MKSFDRMVMYSAGAVAFGIVIGYTQIARYTSSLFKKKAPENSGPANDDDEIYFAGCGGFLP